MINYLIELEDFPKYFVGVDGVYSEKSGKIKKLKSSICRGYYKVNLYQDGKQYKKSVHRLIAQTFTPNPNNLKQVDHINRDRLDNRLENLRWVTNKDNGRNRSMSKDNTSGYQGVRFHKSNNSWAATWCDKEGKQKTKTFSINKYGTDAKKLAIEYRQKIVDELYNRV